MNLPDWSRSKVYDYVVKHMNDGCCTPWPFGTAKGYGMIRKPRAGSKYNELIRVARLVCELTHGPAPHDKPFARHLCGKGHLGCFNAACIVWGSKLENEQDKQVHGTILAGEKHNMVKLTWTKVRKIRAMGSSYSQRTIAAKYGVTQSQISLIQLNRSWYDPSYRKVL